jgi:hypothetical protein
MRKNNNFFKALIGGSIFFLTMAFVSNATTLALIPSATDIAKGTNVDFDVVVSDFGTSGIGAFTFEVDFDSDILKFDGWTMSNDLGDVKNGEASEYDCGEITDGVAQFNGVSWLDSDPLIAMQGDKISLGTISLTGIGIGTSEVAFNPSVTFLGNAFAGQIVLAETDHNSASVNVPEPSSIMLSLSGLLSLLGVGAFRRKKI